MHTLQLLLFLVMYLVIIFFQQNKLSVTFNKMITSGKSDWLYSSCRLTKWAACLSSSGPAFRLKLNNCAYWLNCVLYILCVIIIRDELVEVFYSHVLYSVECIILSSVISRQCSAQLHLSWVTLVKNLVNCMLIVISNFYWFG